MSHQERQALPCSAARSSLRCNATETLQKLKLYFLAPWRTARDVQNSLARLIEAASQEMPSPHDVTIHTLRQTFASWLVQGGHPCEK